MPEAARRYLTFHSGQQAYALPAEEVAEIIAMPAVARLPQSPAALLGMANLRGAVIAVASLRGLLGQAEGTPGARAILLGGAAPVAVSVDAVEALVALDSGQVETRQTVLAAAPGELLCGAFQRAPDVGVTKILDIRPLLAAAFTPMARDTRKMAKPAALQVQAEQAAPDRLISFQICGQEYALNLTEVREIVPLPANVAAVPRGEALLLGVVALRGMLLPLLSLRGLLGFALAETQPATAKVIVIDIAGVPAGLVVDQANAVIPAPPERLQPAPALLKARMGGEARVRAIYRGEDGRIISVLAVENLFGEEVMARLSEWGEQHSAPLEAEHVVVARRQFLVFRLGAEEFGLPIAAVDEVAAAPAKITRLPKTPKFLEGAVNLRGEVLPVIDQRRRFDMADADSSARKRLLVVRSERHRAGLLVDDIAGVVSAPEEDIAPAPDLAGQSVNMVDGVLNLEAAGRMVLLLNPDELLSRAERGLLDNFAAQTAQTKKK
jgi:purine-binding chemotaxis protein CheW